MSSKQTSAYADTKHPVISPSAIQAMPSVHEWRATRINSAETSAVEVLDADDLWRATLSGKRFG
ncbi:MAG: hypothetical protein QXY49_07355 [Thermofilaceae archaeon]